MLSDVFKKENSGFFGERNWHQDICEVILKVLDAFTFLFPDYCVYLQCNK